MTFKKYTTLVPPKVEGQASHVAFVIHVSIIILKKNQTYLIYIFFFLFIGYWTGIK
jgi:hypothetical protein